MSLLIPPAKNYPSPLVSLPSRLLKAPREGHRAIPCEINWLTMGGAENCVNINLQNNATLEFSQICALKVDNSICGIDVQFIFPDTSETITFPAYSPTTIVPVFTNQTQFFVVGTGTEAVDTTRFQILNYCPPPVAVPDNSAQNLGSILGVAMGVGVTQIVPATASGTLEAMYITTQSVTSIDFDATFEFEDGQGNALPSTGLSLAGGSNATAVIMNLNPLALRFKDGIILTQSGTFPDAASKINVNMLYRTP